MGNMQKHSSIVFCVLMIFLLINKIICQENTNDVYSTKRIERLELQLTKIRQDIDNLRQSTEPHTQNFTKHIARRKPNKFTVTAFHGNWYTARGMKDDFRVSDRIVTVRTEASGKCITGYGIVVALESDAIQIEELIGSHVQLEDEVYVISREDTAASLANIF